MRFGNSRDASRQSQNSVPCLADSWDLGFWSLILPFSLLCMYRYSFRVSLSEVDLAQFTVAWNKAKKLKVGGHFQLRTSWLLRALVSWSVVLQISLWPLVLHLRANSFLRSKQERPGRQRSYKTRIMGEGDRFEMMGRTLQNPQGSSGLRILPVETGKNWFWVSWEHSLFWIYAIKFHYRTTEKTRLAFFMYI